MLAVAVVASVWLFVAQPFAIPSASMTPTLRPGDRVLVLKLDATDVHRGDVVVFHEPAGWGPAAGGTDYVKRVVGLPGDRVACCTAHGRVTVDAPPHAGGAPTGEAGGTPIPLREPYLHPGDAPSEVRFDVRVPPDHVWVMGDHRSDSDDSRSHLGDPGGGMVPLQDVVGHVAYRYWPPSRFGPVPRHQPEAVVR